MGRRQGPMVCGNVSREKYGLGIVACHNCSSQLRLEMTAPSTPTTANLEELSMPAAGARKTVLITGVSRGLGKALAVELAKRGHTIIGCSRSQDKLNSLHAELASASSSTSSSQNKHLIMKVDVVHLLALSLSLSLYAVFHLNFVDLQNGCNYEVCDPSFTF